MFDFVVVYCHFHWKLDPPTILSYLSQKKKSIKQPHVQQIVRVCQMFSQFDLFTKIPQCPLIAH